MTITNKNSFEEALVKLEEASQQLKKEDITLQEALKSFEEGIGHYNTCNKILDETKQKIETYTKEGED